jgi:hypothetical protein
MLKSAGIIIGGVLIFERNNIAARGCRSTVLNIADIPPPVPDNLVSSRNSKQCGSCTRAMSISSSIIRTLRAIQATFPRPALSPISFEGLLHILTLSVYSPFFFLHENPSCHTQPRIRPVLSVFFVLPFVPFCPIMAAWTVRLVYTSSLLNTVSVFVA